MEPVVATPAPQGYDRAAPQQVPPRLASVSTYVQRHRTALQPHVGGGIWMNFMNGNGQAARERIREAYLPEAHERLLALKAKYDPDNMFRFSYQLGDRRPR